MNETELKELCEKFNANCEKQTKQVAKITSALIESPIETGDFKEEVERQIEILKILLAAVCLVNEAP